MSETKFKGSPVRVAGEFITAGAEAPAFELVKSDLSPLRLSDLKGKRVVLNIFPSLDTSVCPLRLPFFLAARCPFYAGFTPAFSISMTFFAQKKPRLMQKSGFS